MYAIVATGGKQLKVEEGQIVKVEKLQAEKGDKISLPVLMIADGDKITTGNPIAKASVQAEVLYQDKYDKVIIFKYKSKKTYRKRQGHRQPYTAIKILSIKAK